jgi:hypothetical protein
MAIIGGYLGLYAISKIIGAVSGGKKKAETITSGSSFSASSTVPSVEDPAFGEWIGKDGNVEKLFA